MCEILDRQAGAEYRGVILPEGMTVACLDRLAALFWAQDHPDFETDINDYISADVRAAVTAFEIVRQELHQR